MDTNFHTSRLRYLHADDIDDSAIDFDGLDVRGPDGNKLGDLDGFVLDQTSGRVYYAVVDSGGWFSSRRFLLPIGHAQLDRDRPALTVDVTKDAIHRYPEFDADRFRQFSEPEMRAFEQRMAVACCPDDSRSVDAAIQYRRCVTTRSPAGGGANTTEPIGRGTSPAPPSATFSPDAASLPVRRPTGSSSPHAINRAMPATRVRTKAGVRSPATCSALKRAASAATWETRATTRTIGDETPSARPPRKKGNRTGVNGQQLAVRGKRP